MTSRHFDEGRGKWILPAALVAVALSACNGGAPGADDFEMSKIQDSQAVVADYRAAIDDCMHDAGYGDFEGTQLEAGSILGGVLPLDTLVATATADARESRDSTNSESGYVKSHGLDGAESQVFYDAFLKCDDERSEALANSKSDRRTATLFLRNQYVEMTSSAEYQAAFAAYNDCMAQAGWDTDTNTQPGLAEVVGAITAAATIDSPGQGWGMLGVGGATLDAAKMEEAQRLQDSAVADDDRCARDTLDPVITPFADKYSQLFIALYGTGFGPAFHARTW